mmetsp:Transcript_108973/g.303036  ORF Transcript_108973/g.303036 Transcript_108973/m.303036 type:complete len:334 (-) Transcript_108973:180-1181(-)
MHPEILGYGERAWWPDGLGAKINAVRRFVLQQADDTELVFFADAFDTMLFGDAGEITSKFESMEQELRRSIIFNSEMVCFPNLTDICADYPESPHHRWRYLNSGLFIGRVGALKEMFRDPVDNIMPGGDQAWFQRYFKKHQDTVAVDVHCKLLCATTGIGVDWGIALRGDRLENLVTANTPAAVHFAGPAHWPIWRGGAPTTEIGEVFQQLYPEESARLFGHVEVFMRIGGAYRNSLLSLSGARKASYVRFMRAVLCAQCCSGSGQRECKYVARGLASPICSDVAPLVAIVALVSLCGCLACARRRGRLLEIAQEKGAKRRIAAVQMDDSKYV